MESKKKVIFTLAVFALLAVIALGAYIYTSQNTVNNSATSNTSSTHVNSVSKSNATTNTITPPQATSNIDDGIKSILLGVDVENSEAQKDGITESTLTSDSDALQSFGQSYDENEYQ